ncbi:MAG: helix-turn-helix domain-containing protein [Limisphaerales bacterium]
MREPDLMTVEEVARYLRLKPQTIYKWAQEKRIPAVKLGKEWRFRKRILDEWLDGQILENQNDRNDKPSDPEESFSK